MAIALYFIGTAVIILAAMAVYVHEGLTQIRDNLSILNDTLEEANVIAERTETTISGIEINIRPRR
jgi:hypothetical protein